MICFIQSRTSDLTIIPRAAPPPCQTGSFIGVGATSSPFKRLAERTAAFSAGALTLIIKRTQ